VSFCNGCGAALTLTAAAAAGAGTTVAPPVPTTKPCPFCGEQIQQAAIRCRFCSSDLTAPRQQQGGISVTGPSGVGAPPSIVIQNVQAAQQPAQPTFVPQEIKNPGIAMLLSILIPGGGQFYNGHAGKGILILLTCWLIIPWIWGIFDAYNCAKRINRTGR
jgi:hypothetical protein